MVEWYNILLPEIGAFIREAGFELIIGLLLKRPISATLVQCLIERWWNTTHTFHITEREIIVTPYDFYCMIGLSFKGAIINLDDVSCIQLGLNMLGGSTSLRPSAILNWC